MCSTPSTAGVATGGADASGSFHISSFFSKSQEELIAQYDAKQAASAADGLNSSGQGFSGSQPQAQPQQQDSQEQQLQAQQDTPIVTVTSSLSTQHSPKSS
jgi:hypothetical protein